MTIQFSIVNSRRHIFASDDGITTPEGKKYEGMQKIYKLSDIHPAKMMINGNMEFEGIPIETIINEFVKKTDFNKLKNIEDIKNRFIEFLAEYCPQSSIDDYIGYAVENFKDDLVAEIEEIGFNKVVETRRKKKIYPFVEAYCGFHEEFTNIIPQAKDIEKYTRILGDILLSS